MPVSAEIHHRNRPLAKISAIAFWAIHASCLFALWTPFAWKLLALALGGYVLRMWAITAGYHRYFAHRSYKTGRVFQFVLAWIGAASVQKGPLWWASWHRVHHKYSDTERDTHSPTRRGFWYSHVGWFLGHEHDATDLKAIKDFARFPELRFIDRCFWLPPLSYAIVCGLIAGLPGLVWGFSISTVLLWHGTFVINSLSHVWGSRRYETSDTSRNNPLLALITLGEGWHNNHHHYMNAANQGFFWWEVDFSYYTIRALAALGVVWDVRTPPEHLRDPAAANARAVRTRLEAMCAEVTALAEQLSGSLGQRRQDLAAEFTARRAALLQELRERRSALAADWVSGKEVFIRELDQFAGGERSGDAA